MRGRKYPDGKGKRSVGGVNGVGHPIKPGEHLGHELSEKVGAGGAARRKQLTLLVLTFALAFALYLNWNYSSAGGSLPITDLVQQVSWSGEEQKNYGDAKYVSAENDYFAEARLQRRQSRDRSLEDLKAVLSASTLSEADKQKASEELSLISSYGATEASIESLIKAKGFSDCVVFISETGVKVVVASQGLSDSEVAQITETVIEGADVPAVAINIVEIN